MMKIYNYNKETKEFTIITTATESPLEKEKYIIPANATDKEPLEAKDGFVVCFNEEQNNWEYIEDNRNKIAYSILTKQEIKVDYLGPIKNGHTLLKPTQFDKWNDATKSWIEDIELIRASKLNDIKNIYEIEANKNVVYNEVTYKGGESSASAIAGAVDLAKALGETTAKIIDVNDDENLLSFEEAMKLSAQIAHQWREAFLKYKKLKRTINNEKDIEIIKQITWGE